MDAKELCFLSADRLSGLIVSKEVSPVEVVQAHLERIEATEPVLNSFITRAPVTRHWKRRVKRNGR